MKSVQTILVTHHGSHLETIRAASLASARSIRQAGDPRTASQHPWKDWLTGDYTKIIKRTSPAKVRATHAEFGGTLAHDPHTGLTVCALAPLEDTTENRKRLPGQVSGVERTKPKLSASIPPGRWLVLHGELGMSTGKASAQAAHVHTLMALRSMPLDDLGVLWASAPLFHHLQQDARSLIHVQDNGLTEIPEGTATAMLVEMVGAHADKNPRPQTEALHEG